ncbi:MAG: hypothetical protein NTX88_11560 [Candidatus Atribacteria bacterium]|nr:hypothetical protein [Candidatus Atribacteria bacterium]
MDDVVIQKSWEFVPHDGSGFLHVAMRTAANWMEARRQTEQTRWCTTFVKEGTLAAKVGSLPVQMAIFVVIFGSEELSSAAKAPSKQTDMLPPAVDRKKWWQFWK